MKNVFFYDYSITSLGIAESDGAICRVFFGKKMPAPLQKSGFVLAETPLIKKAAAQLAEYFNGKRKNFDLPLAPQGTEFQSLVWKKLLTIPFGKTRSYGEIAESIGRPKASRAVGMANNRNPIVIIIPCHRVIGHDGSLTGYGGGLKTKKFLLDMEAGLDV